MRETKEKSDSWGGYVDITAKVERCSNHSLAILCSDNKVIMDGVICKFFCDKSCEKEPLGAQNGLISKRKKRA